MLISILFVLIITLLENESDEIGRLQTEYNHQSYESVIHFEAQLIPTRPCT